MVMSKGFLFLPTSFPTPLPVVFLSSYSCTITTCHKHRSLNRTYRVACLVWDVHHPWAGKPLFSGHMRMTPMCFLCIPAFPKVPEYASERRRSGSRPQEFRKSSDHFRT